MEDWNGIFNKSSGLGEFRSTSSSTRDDHHDQDFDEEDVWGTISVSHESSPTNMKKLITSKTSPTPRSIPRRANTSEAKVGKLVQQSSAPMKIPDWSKIYGKTTSSNIARNNIVNGFNHGCDHHDNIVGYDDHDHADDADDDDDDDDDMVPPHEWIARKLARSQISSFSVCEGIGRTLKGRDLSKVRNAILTKTGFLE